MEIRAEDDRALTDRLRRRERGAFDELYRLHHERIWAFLVRLCGRRDDAEDLFQETWCQAAKHAHRLEEGSRLLPWLFTIARNEHRSARRFVLFDFRKREAFAAEPLPASAAPDDALARRREVARVEEALAALSDAEREVLLLASVEGLGAAEIAPILGLREDAVRKRLSRARAALAARLGRHEAQEKSP